MTHNLEPHPQFAHLLNQYARDLAQIEPSTELDARIDQLVAGRRTDSRVPYRPHRRLAFYAAAAGFAALAISVGIFIGMKLEHSHKVSANAARARDTTWPPADLAMWPTDSVSFKVPAEYSAQGTLVAVDPDATHGSTRYWIDIVVSNDGTFRIEQIVPADPAHKQGGTDGDAPQIR